VNHKNAQIFEPRNLIPPKCKNVSTMKNSFGKSWKHENF